MSYWAFYKITVTKGDAKEVNAFLEGHHWFKGCPDSDVQTGVNEVNFAATHGCPEVIFDELASSHPDYEFTVLTDWECCDGDVYKDFFANGKFIKRETIFKHIPSDAELAFYAELQAKTKTKLN